MSLENYTDLITNEHITKPNYIATLGVSFTPFVQLIELLNNMPELYNVDTATGFKLDVVGQWVGRSRKVEIPLEGVYFSFDDSVFTGWDSGVWKSEFDPDSGLLLLPDDQYRVLIKAKIAANSWNGTIPAAYQVWQDAFPEGSQIIIQDNQDMTIIIAIFGFPLDAVTFELLTGGYIPLKPEGVKILNYSIAPDNGPIFAWDVSSSLLKGYDEGSWPNEIVPS